MAYLRRGEGLCVLPFPELVINWHITEACEYRGPADTRNRARLRLRDLTAVCSERARD